MVVAVELAELRWPREQAAKSVSGSIAPGATLVVPMVPPAALSNREGSSPLNSQGIKVHGVSYTRSQASQPGRTIPFQS
jgi:hypothetical protein